MPGHQFDLYLTYLLAQAINHAGDQQQCLSRQFRNRRSACVENVDEFADMIDAAFLDMPWYLNVFEAGSELRTGLGRWITYYNTQRPHSGLPGRTPREAYGRIDASSYGGVPPI